MLVTRIDIRMARPGDDRRQEQRRGGNAQHEADDDIGDRRRDQDAGTGPGRNQRAGIGAGISRFDQPVDGHAADCGGAGGVGAGNRREHAADQHRGRAEAALGKLGQRLGDIEKLAAQPGPYQHVAGQDEQRHGGEGEVVDPVKQALADQRQRQRAGDDQHQDRGRSDRRPDRYGQRD